MNGVKMWENETFENSRQMQMKTWHVAFCTNKNKVYIRPLADSRDFLLFHFIYVLSPSENSSFQ